MTIVGFGASWLKAVFFADNLALNAFFFFLGKWVFDILYFIGEQRVHGVELAAAASPLVAALGGGDCGGGRPVTVHHATASASRRPA